MILLVTVTLLLAAAIAWALVNENRPVLFPTPVPPTFAEVVTEFSSRIREAGIVLGQSFLPVMKQVTEAMADFGQSFKGVDATMSRRSTCPICKSGMYDGVCPVRH